MKKHTIVSLILVLTTRCNLSCRYCYLDAKNRGQSMSETTLNQALALIDHGSPCHIQITGGEPTLVPEHIAMVAEKSATMANRPKLAIQTNATLLTRDMVSLFKEYEIQVGISLDGPPDVHDRLRGQATKCLRGMKLLESEGVPFRVTTVICEENILHLDRLALLLAGFTNSRGIGLDLLVNRGRASKNSLQPPSAKILENGIKNLLNTLTRINKHRIHPIHLRELDTLHSRSSKQTFCQASKGKSLAVHPDGNLYPCSQTLRDKDFHLGTVQQPATDFSSPLTTIRLQNKLCGQCSVTKIRKSCPGDCPSRIHYNSGKKKNLTCTLYRHLIRNPHLIL